MVNALHQAAPAAAMVADNRGYLPLHVALDDTGNRTCPVVVEALLKAAPQATMAAEKEYGHLPLHVAAFLSCNWFDQGLAIIELLLKANPEATMVSNRRGQLPLHCVARAPATTYAQPWSQRY